MHDQFETELLRLIGILLVAALFGSATGHWAFFMALGLAGLMLWHLQQIYLLERWIHGGIESEQQNLAGVWSYLAEFSQRNRKQNRKRKKRLSRLLQRFHETLEAMPDAAIVADDNFQVQWANSAAQKILGVSHRRSEKSLDEMLPDAVFRGYLGRGDYRVPLELVSPLNPLQELELRMTRFGRGQLLITAHDITDSKRLQAVRRDFIANVSHELRTPLTVITGYLEMLQEERLDAAIAEAIDASNRQAKRMQSIVRDLLMLSRLEMEGENQQAVTEPVAIPAILSHLVTDAERLSGERQHHFQLSADPTLNLMGSESELTSAFGNLIFNAVIHTPAGTAIDIYWGREGNGARLVVADQGPGIEGVHLQRLTERFYRVDKGRSRDRGGTGLGLSIVKHVVKRHQGSVEIESTPGHGSRFICHFPAGRVQRL